MIKNFTFLFFLCFTFSAIAQINNNQRDYNNYNQQGGIDNRFVENPQDSTQLGPNEVEINLSDKTYYTDYKIIGYKNDTTYIDTTLNIKKYYKFNYLRKDNLELLAFANQGQTFNHLAYTFDDNSLFPKMGARAQHFNYAEVKDVNYYHVATPTTILQYRAGMEQGQVLDALFTFNTSRRLNGSISYQGLRSLGNYRNTLSAHEKTIVTLNYRTRNDKYYIRSHIVAQNLTNNQNGGLTVDSIDNFENNDENFKDRARLVTNFTDANNNISGNRYYFDQYYKIWQKKDTTRFVDSELKVGHIFNYELKQYKYNQGSSNSIFGASFTPTVQDRLTYSKFFSEAYLSLTSPITLGEVKFKINYFDYNYSYKSIVFKPDNQIINSNINGKTIAAGGEWNTKFKKINFTAEASTIISGDLRGNNISASAQYVIDSTFAIRAKAFTNSKSPNFNFILFQSAYKSYNWQNNFKNEQKSSLSIELDSKKWIYALLQVTNIDNYTYFDAPEINQQTKPVQASETINYLKLKLSKEFKFGHFALDNQFIYQKVASGSEVFRVPDFITRNTFYYSNYIFKAKSLYLQTGITFSYFSKYFMNSYNPVLSEFNLQNNQEIGGYPIFDFFVNAQIRTVRLYFKIEHLNSSFLGNFDYYSAPAYPYVDFKLRFGLVWNFFI
ncbi:MAG: putative porin [Flavobacteriaceae bacterium]|nr:putative porin [Flavobacteriaceae bacterium]